MFASKRFRLASLFATLVMALTMVSIDQAEARRGGSFGSRGTRTFNSAPATNTSPNVTAPVQRTMTPAQQAQPRTTAQAGQQQRGAFGGFGGIMTGLMFGGLLGMMFGGGFGGFGGIFAMLIQVLIIGFIASWLLRRFARPQMAGAGGPRSGNSGGNGRSGLGGSGLGGMGNLGQRSAAPKRPRNPNELSVGGRDLDQFQQMLTEVQTAFGAEDYGTLRRLTTPEMMSYLSEELGENASRGVKNEVSAVTLLQGDISESWREGQSEFATAAMRYESIDVTRDRASGQVVDGDADSVSQTTELWTFVRQIGREWKLSAIQQA